MYENSPFTSRLSFQDGLTQLNLRLRLPQVQEHEARCRYDLFPVNNTNITTLPPSSVKVLDKLQPFSRVD